MRFQVLAPAVLREMKKLSKIIAKHAERHKDLLEQYWQETDFKEGDVRQIVSRIGGVLEKLPAAVRQAHERIIGERQVKNEDKILSLYEDHAAVYVRGKAGAEVEFGSQLLLGECAIGAINALSSSCASGLGVGGWQAGGGHQDAEAQLGPDEGDGSGSGD